MKTVYLYDKDTGEFKGAYEAQESPLEPGVYIIPEYSTEIVPPASVAGKFRKFAMNKWTQANDTRGLWYLPDGTLTEVESLLLDVIPADWSREAPVIELTLAQKFELVRQALQASIDAKAYELGQFSSGDALIQYAGFTNAFQPLAQQFGEWEVSVWIQASAYRDSVIAGTAPMVTPEQAVAMMPAYPA